MFKEITQDKLNAEELKNRLLAYASLSAAEEKIDDSYWYGNISTYTLKLRLSGIFGEKKFTDILSNNIDTNLNIGKYIYLENSIFIRDTQYLNNLDFVEQLYQAFLRRKADPGGLQGNLNQLNNGALRKNLVQGIRSSGEADNVFLRVTDCLDNKTFINIAYRVYLNPENRQLRLPEDSKALKQNTPRQEVFAKIKQFQKLQTALQNLQEDFHQKDQEFLKKTKHLADEDFVKTLYRTFLKREADPGGLDSCLQKIIYDGESRQKVLYSLRTCKEAANVFVDKLTRNLDNATFIEVAAVAFLKQQLTPKQKVKALNILDSGQIRQTILKDFNKSSVTKKQKITEKETSNSQPKKEHSQSNKLDNSVSQAKLSPLEKVTQKLNSNFYRDDQVFLANTEQLSNQEFIKRLYRTFFEKRG